MKWLVYLVVSLVLIRGVSAIECPNVNSPWRINALQNIEITSIYYPPSQNRTITLANYGSINLTGVNLSLLSLLNNTIVFYYNESNITIPVNSTKDVLVTVNISGSIPRFMYEQINISDDTGNATDSIDVIFSYKARRDMVFLTESNCTFNEVLITFAREIDLAPKEGSIDVYHEDIKIANLYANSTGQTSFIPTAEGEYVLKGQNPEYKPAEHSINISNCGNISVCKECCFQTIQEGINNSFEGGIVVVTDGKLYKQSIQVTRSNITIDCRNATIENNAGIALYIGGQSDVTLMNCMIQNSNYGVFFHGGNNIALVNNSIMNNTHGVYLRDALPNDPPEMKVNISGNKLVENHYYGLYVGYLVDVLIEDNNISNNDENGIFFFKSSNKNPILIKNNFVAENGGSGVEFASTWNTLVENSIIQNNNGSDVHLDWSGVTFLNTTFNKSKVYVSPYHGSSFNVSWYLVIILIDSYNKSVEGANVEIKDFPKNVVDRDVTDENGFTKLFILTEYLQTQNSLTNYTPHNVTVRKWRPEVSTTVYMNESKQITLLLDDLGPVLRHQMDVETNWSYTNNAVTLKILGHDGKPLNRVDVDVYFENYKLFNLESGEDGIVEFTPIEEGRYAIKVEKTRYRDEELRIDISEEVVKTTTLDKILCKEDSDCYSPCGNNLPYYCIIQGGEGGRICTGATSIKFPICKCNKSGGDCYVGGYGKIPPLTSSTMTLASKPTTTTTIKRTTTSTLSTSTSLTTTTTLTEQLISEEKGTLDSIFQRLLSILKKIFG